MFKHLQENRPGDRFPKAAAVKGHHPRRSAEPSPSESRAPKAGRVMDGRCPVSIRWANGARRAEEVPPPSGEERRWDPADKLRVQGVPEFEERRL